ncbi:MAG: LLM class flavin-dependent oxidoreductase [Defluviicoccus sp.]|nr:LLM class flavin-dependent oxidoreductase [Defluviicoccus sp.]MDE0278971.1 LLM class flavin-dependent oxidoreductase [Defluviicoccus sp.]
MKFGYFTLSDNHYVGNERTANDYIRDIAAEAIHAEAVGMHSAWIGEHHFSTLGVLSCPDIVLGYVAAVTERIRLAPAVNVLPLHHPIRVAEQWATLDLLSDGRVDFATGRGYDKREYIPLDAPYENNTEAFAEGLEVLHRLWTETEPVTHKGRFYDFENVSITPKPVQKPPPIYVACFSRPSIELAGRLGHNVVVAPFAAAMQFGGLGEMAEIYNEACAKHGNPPGRLICSYFAHFADSPEEDLAARTSQVRYFQECCIHALPQDIEKAPPTYHYFVDMVKNMKAMTPEGLTDKSILVGDADAIGETLKKVEEAGFAEVILYFNVGLKPHRRVKDEMQRFMEEVAPAFADAEGRLAAAE